MQRLSSRTLSNLPPAVRRPRYDREALQVGIAHIGVGAFHRCHQAEYVDDMLEARFGPWGLVGINLYPPRLADLLVPQDCLYSRTVREGDSAETRVVGSIRRVIDVLDAKSAEAAVAALGAPAVQVVTMTVTEKGYCLVPSSGNLDRENQAVEADLAGAFPPRTLLGLLTRALERRRAAGAAGLTLVSCDNIPRNGARLRKAMLAYAGIRSPSLVPWIERHVAFPSTMVDRITPATSHADVEAVSVALGVRDDAAVVGEPFHQWVLEDAFAGERPPLDLVGAEFTSDSEPYEQIKMRILNAAQSTLSHQGALVGYEFSFDAAGDPILSALTHRMLERETASTLPDVTGMETGRYIETSLTRVRNHAIRHRCHQIGTDGSQKIVQRLVDPLRERLAAGRSADLLTLAISSWIAYCLAGSSRFGRRWAPSDPWADRVISIGDQSADFDDAATAILGIAAIFGGALARPGVANAVASHLRGLLGDDARGYLMARLGDP
jgi:fructuronate reductase